MKRTKILNYRLSKLKIQYWCITEMLTLNKKTLILKSIKNLNIITVITRVTSLNSAERM